MERSPSTAAPAPCSAAVSWPCASWWKTPWLGDPALAVTADPLILASAVSNLLNNAFKFTPAGGHVILRAHTNSEGRLLIEVEDECGGIPPTNADPFQAFGSRRGPDRTGLGLGLSIARKAVRAHGSDIHVQNFPGKGCVFVIDVALAAEDVVVEPLPAE